MKKIYAVAVAAVLFTVFTTSSAYAVAGIGFHWGFDLSMSMDDANERIGIDAIPGVDGFINELGALGLNVSNDIDLFRFSRSGWDRSVINFGGKVYIDLIPIIPIDAIEVSCNLGLWQYDGVLGYISGVDATGNPTYGEIKLGLEEMGMKSYFGMDGLPYAKLHFDLTAKWLLLKRLPIVKFSGGLGVSAHFATPLLSAGLIEDVVESVEGISVSDLLSALADNDPDAIKTIGMEITKEIRDNVFGRPAFGAHVLLGARAKLPIIPIGVYVDGKFMMPFSSFIDKDEGKGINGWGILLNTGISLSF